MSGGADEGMPAGLPAEEAFAVLGDETRLGILRALGEADEPLAFSTLYERVPIDDSGQFSYHLDKLVGQFVRKHAGASELTQAGRRVVTAVLAGTVTDDQIVGRTTVEEACHLCGARMAVNYRDGQVGMHCPSCGGQYAGRAAEADASERERPPRQRIGYLELPPAGVDGREPRGVLDAAYTWHYNRLLSMVSGVCPSCGAGVRERVAVCEDHEHEDEICEACGFRVWIRIDHECRNCIESWELSLSNQLLTEPALHEFMLDHGVDVVSPSRETVLGARCETTVTLRSRDSFRASVTDVIDDDRLVLTVDEDLEVVATERERAGDQ